MSNKPVILSVPVVIMNVRCAACFSLNRNLRPMKETSMMNSLCPGLNFSEYTLVCWECEHIIKKIKQFKERIIKTQTLFKTMDKDVQVGRDGLTNLETSFTTTVSLTGDSIEKYEVKYNPIRLNCDSGSERDNIGHESSNDYVDNWSNTDSCKSYSDVKCDSQSFNVPMKRPDNTATSDWLKHEKLRVPKIIGSNTMTLKELLDQPLRYYTDTDKQETMQEKKTENEKEDTLQQKKSNVKKEGTPKKEDEGASGMQKNSNVEKEGTSKKKGQRASGMQKNSNVEKEGTSKKKGQRASGMQKNSNVEKEGTSKKKGQRASGMQKNSNVEKEGTSKKKGQRASGMQKNSNVEKEGTSKKKGQRASGMQKNSNVDKEGTSKKKDKRASGMQKKSNVEKEGTSKKKDKRASGMQKNSNVEKEARSKKEDELTSGMNGGTGENQENGDACTENRNCAFCFLIFHDQKVFDEHMKSHSNMSSDLFCSICQESFANKELYDDHCCVNHQKNKRPAVPLPIEESPEEAKKLKTDESKTTPLDITKLLSNTTERKLIDWITYLHKHGFEVTKDIILNKLSLILTDDEKIGLNSEITDLWYECFFTRKYDDITACLLPKVEIYPTEHDIQKWSDSVKESLDIINLGHVLNNASRVFTCEQIQFSVYIDDIESCANVFLNISAEGRLVTPVVCLPNGNIEGFFNFPNTWVVKHFSNSMDKESFYDYITKSFYEWLLTNETELPVILFVDEYTSKISLELFDFCVNKDIVLFALPPYLEHLLKPLNGYYISKVNENFMKELEVLKNITEVGDIILKCLNDGLNEVIIKSNFETAGLCPFKPIDKLLFCK